MALKAHAIQESVPLLVKIRTNLWPDESKKNINDILYVEYAYVPFKGYRHDKLVLLILRDITRKETS